MSRKIPVRLFVILLLMGLALVLFSYISKSDSDISYKAFFNQSTLERFCLQKMKYKSFVVCIKSSNPDYKISYNEEHLRYFIDLVRLEDFPVFYIPENGKDSKGNQLTTSFVPNQIIINLTTKQQEAIVFTDGDPRAVHTSIGYEKVGNDSLIINVYIDNNKLIQESNNSWFTFIVFRALNVSYGKWDSTENYANTLSSILYEGYRLNPEKVPFRITKK